jgi:thiopeptide-type bacteriocin biosynthesis protein
MAAIATAHARRQLATELVLRCTEARYVPEVDRYGGSEGMAIAERFFFASSVAALALLSGIPDRRARLARGLAAMTVCCRTFCRQAARIEGFARSYSAGYLATMGAVETGLAAIDAAFRKGIGRQDDALWQYLDALDNAMEDGEAIGEPLDSYAAALQSIRVDLAAAGRTGSLGAAGRALTEPDAWVSVIVPSYVHMMNNRLGITVLEEAYLAAVLASWASRRSSRAPLHV